MMKRASDLGAVQFIATNPRDFCYDRHMKVDDVPFGGAAGMLLKAEPIALALESIGIEMDREDSNVEVIVTDPTGVLFDQRIASEFSTKKRLVFFAVTTREIDHRITQRFATRAVSIGDFVLTNGELPALIMADAAVRLLPGGWAAQKAFGRIVIVTVYSAPQISRGQRSGAGSRFPMFSRAETIKRSNAGGGRSLCWPQEVYAPTCLRGPRWISTTSMCYPFELRLSTAFRRASGEHTGHGQSGQLTHEYAPNSEK